ncbi:hypothetical protein H9M94_01750 [Mycoplasma sp. Pen4]|uniref:hypothetical protein n=1 Tax=Mycoplasma sp. Pen4 TaxID=640330 RepID=UPI001654B646|nr:hypothetical protein [Mycoplasma sp. Pen4]QNM93336.1 hypothetical protein H9M94_01750 [Mycoplasma sp. Pen4]
MLKTIKKYSIFLAVSAFSATTFFAVSCNQNFDYSKNDKNDTTNPNQRKLQELAAKLKQIDSKIEKTLNETARLTKENKSIEEQIKTLQPQIEAAKTKEQETRTAFEEISSRLEILRGKKDKLVDGLKQERIQIEAQKISSEKRITTLEEETKTKETQIQALRPEVSGYEGSIENYGYVIANKTQESQRLEANIVDLEDEIRTLKSQGKDDSDSEVHAKQLELNDLTREKDELLSFIRDVETKKQQLQETKKQKEAQIKQLEQEITDSGREIFDLKNSLEEITNKIEALKNPNTYEDVVAVDNEIKQFNDEFNTKEEAHKHATLDYRNLNVQYEQLRRQYNGNTTQITVISNDQMKELTLEKNKIKQEISELQ